LLLKAEKTARFFRQKLFKFRAGSFLIIPELFILAGYYCGQGHVFALGRVETRDEVFVFWGGEELAGG